MEREIIEREIQVERENIIAFPKDNYYTKTEVDDLLDDKANQNTVDGIITDVNSIEDEQILQNNAITNLGNDISDISTNMTRLSLITETGSQIALNISTSDYKMTAILKDKNGNTIYTSNVIDLPLESVVVDGRYDNVSKKIILTLQNGSTVEFSVADLVSGLQTEITSSNKLSSDLVNDANATNKFVTSSEKTTWNGKQDALVSGTNIKTINNTSLLGSGNIDIGSSGGEEQVIYVKYNDNFATIIEKLTTFYNNYTNDIATILIWTPSAPENKNCLLRVMSDYGSFIECKGQIDGSITNISNYGVTYKKATEVVLKIYIQNDEVTNYTVTTNDYGYIPSSVDEILGMYNTIQYTPTNDYNPATKKYVDDNSIKTIAEDTKIYELANGVYLSTGTTYKLYYSSNTSYYIKCPGILIVTEYSYVKKFVFIAKGGYVKTQSVQLDTANPYIIVGDSRASSSTSAPYVYDLTNMSMNNVAQTITALKTFSTLPESSVTPTTNNQLVNKAYVDGLVGNINTVLATLTTVGGGN